MPEFPRLRTERFHLRPFSLDDAEDVQRLAGVFEVADTTLTIPHPYEDGVAEEWIGQHQEAFDRREGVTLAVTRQADGQLLGAIGLMHIEEGHQAEIGYWIGKPFWNEGFCTEAAAEVLTYAFTALGLKRVHARPFSRNPASGRVLRKLGFSHEGSQRRHVRRWGEFEDIELYGILKEEWQSRRYG